MGTCMRTPEGGVRCKVVVVGGSHGCKTEKIKQKSLMSSTELLGYRRP